MLLFKLLVLAHLVADFPLQSARVYRLKTTNLAGQLPHACIVLAAMALACYPLAGEWSFWAFATAVAGLHLLIDALKVDLGDRGTWGGSLWAFLLDQAMHVATLATVFLTPLPAAPGLQASALERLDVDGAITLAILFLTATFGGVYLLSAVRRTLFEAGGGARSPGGFEKYYGIAERGALFLIMTAGGWALCLVPLVLLVRVPAANRAVKRFSPEPFLMSSRNAAGNLLLSAACAFAGILSSRG
ncbi:MAG: DUF3307 domain-containing protein [Chlamydiota bacterium]